MFEPHKTKDKPKPECSAAGPAKKRGKGLLLLPVWVCAVRAKVNWRDQSIPWAELRTASDGLTAWISRPKAVQAEGRRGVDYSWW